MRRYLPTLLLVAFAFVSSALAQTAPPNIVVILADDLGYGDVGFNGCLDIPTPNIDSVAANGALCTNGYATHPYCSPSPAALNSGLDTILDRQLITIIRLWACPWRS